MPQTVLAALGPLGARGRTREPGEEPLCLTSENTTDLQGLGSSKGPLCFMARRDAAFNVIHSQMDGGGIDGSNNTKLSAAFVIM